MAKLIEPLVASAVARRLAGDAPLVGSYLMERLQRDLETVVPRAEELVAAASGIPSPAPVRWALIDRAAWAEANIKGMGRMLAPLAERVDGKLRSVPAPVRYAQRGVVSVEVGVLLGFVSRRVLGQYDVLVPETADGFVPLYLVGPNLIEVERHYNFVPEEFALWVAVHEVTHRFQFAGVPWLKQRFFELLETYMGAIDLDPRNLAERLAGAARRLMDGSMPAEERSPVYLLASDEQRSTLDSLQALMAVVEGHGNYVMDTVGAQVIPSFARMKRLFERRREQVNAVQRAINYVIGLEMKLRQYEIGQAFCEKVAADGGPSALARLWESPESFPSMAELREPVSWLRRVA
jgi:coenzyme F420 biosynthesis associated uncharacterized protein